MKNSWHIGKIGEFCLVGDGAHASIKRKDEGIPYLTSKNFKEFGLDLSKVDYISIEDYEKYFTLKSNALTKPISGDILISIIGSIGTPYVVKDEEKFGLSSSVAIIRCDDNKLNNEFLYYQFKSSFLRNSLHLIKSGSAQGFLSLNMIKNLPVVIPTIATQKRIANVLIYYDRLIENNTKRIEVLEKMAQEIYKEWFVRMRFPGYEKVRFDKGIPEGWKIIYSEDILDIVTGKLNSNAAVEDGEYPFFTCSNEEFKTNTFSFDTEAVLLAGNNAAGKYPLKYFKGKFDAYQRTYVIQSKEVTSFSNKLIYFYLKERLGHFQTVSTGAATQFLTIKILNKLPMCIPTEEINFKFENYISPMFNQIQILKDKNRMLVKTRDLLLPRLMSGKLSVE